MRITSCFICSYHRAATLADAINLPADNPRRRTACRWYDVPTELTITMTVIAIVDIENCGACGKLRGGRWLVTYGSATTFTQLIEDPITNVISRRYVLRPCPLLDRRFVTSLPRWKYLQRCHQRRFCHANANYDAKLEIHFPRGVRFVPINGFHTGRAKCLLSMTQSSSPFIFRHSQRTRGQRAF